MSFSHACFFSYRHRPGKEYEIVIDDLRETLEYEFKLLMNQGVYRDTKRTKDAIDLYKQLMEKPSQTVSKAAAEFQLAETYQAAGMTADAKKLYEQIQKEAPAQSQANQLASGKLQELKQ